MSTFRVQNAILLEQNICAELPKASGSSSKMKDINQSMQDFEVAKITTSNMDGRLGLIHPTKPVNN